MTLHYPLLTADQTQVLGQRMAKIDPWQRLGFAAPALTAYLNRTDNALQRHAITQNSQIVGALALRAPWLRGPYLELLMVLPEFQNQGIGKKALNWAFHQAASENATNFWACVSAFNQPARAFYAKLGFTETSELTDLVTNGENEILLRKVLYQRP